MLSIAIVDDNPTDVALIQEYLRKYGRKHECEFDIKMYENGLNFLDHFKNAFDILFVRILYYSSVFMLTLCAMKVCFNLSSSEMLFAGVGGYALQHMTHSFINFLEYFFPYDEASLVQYLFHHILLYIMVPLLFI